jgi:hypothetical protein
LHVPTLLLCGALVEKRAFVPVGKGLYSRLSNQD